MENESRFMKVLVNSQKEIDDNIKHLKQHKKERDERISLIKVHLKNNLKWYKSRYDHCESAYRQNAIISSLLSQGFISADSPEIKSFLNKKGIFSLKCFINIMVILQFLLATFFTFYLVPEDSDTKDYMLMFSSSYITLTLFVIISVKIYINTSFFKFYYTGKL